MNEQEIKEALEDIITWKKVTDVNKLYNVYRIVFKDNGHICNRCSRVIRSVHQKLVNYYKERYL